MATSKHVFVSYAQNGEDFILWRMLRDVEAGSYIDVGACEPEIDSVTRAFYERGWSGVNIEPLRGYWRRLCRSRPRDVNLNLAIGAAEGERDFFAIGNTGLSTLDSAIAHRHQATGFHVRPMRIRVRPLSAIWDEVVHGEVHFLKIDVEGAEAEVLAGADLGRQRPWIIVVEATAPLTCRSTHEQWEPMLIRAGYRLVHTDLVNRYYVAGERAVLAQRLDGQDGFGEFIRAAEIEAGREDLPPERRFEPAPVSFLGNGDSTPTLKEPTSQLCTETQLREPLFDSWCRELAEPIRFNCKLWEYAYILQTLTVRGLLAPGRRGLGLECNREPLAAAMAARGCEIVAAAPLSKPAFSGEIVGAPLAVTVEDLNARGLCDPDLFSRRVTCRAVDAMKPSVDLEAFDFVFSTSVLAHLGSIRAATSFALEKMRFLRPGGLAIHIAVFNLSSNYTTLESSDWAVLRRYDVESLVAETSHAGYDVAPLNLSPGAGAMDRYVDPPPYRPEPHLRFRLGPYVVTSLGLIFRKR